MSVALTAAQKKAIRKDSPSLSALQQYLDLYLEDLQAQITAYGKVAQDAFELDLPLERWRNADGTVMDATGGAGLFKVVPGAWSTGGLKLQGEAAQNNTKTDTMLQTVQLPDSYVDDEDLVLKVYAGWVVAAGTTVSGTVDVEVYKLGDDGSVGADLCATAAIALAAADADCEFTITDAGLVTGDRLLIYVRTALTEGGNTGTATAEIGSVRLAADILA